MLVRNSERSKLLFERLDSMAGESWVGPPACPSWPYLKKKKALSSMVLGACRPLLEQATAHSLACSQPPALAVLLHSGQGQLWVFTCCMLSSDWGIALLDVSLAAQAV